MIDMNKRQQIILLMGILLVIVSGLFPPYKVEIRSEGDNYKIYIGHYFLFVPPTLIDIFGNTVKLDPVEAYFSIIASRVWIQDVTIIVTTLGLFFLFAGKQEQIQYNLRKLKGWFRLALVTSPITGIIFSIPSVLSLKQYLNLNEINPNWNQLFIPLPMVQLFAFLGGIILHIVIILLIRLIIINLLERIIIPWIKTGFKD